MAVLTAAQLAKLREEVVSGMPLINYQKAQINAASQAIEDWFEAARPSLNGAINSGTSPLILTAAQKRILVIRYLVQKASRE